MQGSAHTTSKRRVATARKVLKALEKHALSVAPADMKATHIRAAEAVLRKTIPDLRSTEIKGEVALKQFCITRNGADTTEAAD